MIRINLIAAESIKKVERSELLLLGYLIIVGAFVILGAGYVTKFNNYRKIEARVAQDEQELNRYQGIVRQMDSLQSTKNALETRRNVISSLMASRLVYPRFMEELVMLLPANVWFRTLTTQSQADGKLAATLDAQSLDNYSIADAIAALSTNPDFSAVELGPINSAAAERIPSSAFRLTFSHQKRKQ
jgi:Tfp pilus assembly protein PilN